MPPIVMEPPVNTMNMHNASLATLSRLQQYNPNGMDPARQHNQSPVSASPVDAARVPSELLLDPHLDQSEVDASQESPNSAAAKSSASQKCDTCNAPLSSDTRRDSQGKVVCNTCGEYINSFLNPLFPKRFLFCFFFDHYRFCACCMMAGYTMHAVWVPLHNHITSFGMVLVCLALAARPIVSPYSVVVDETCCDWVPCLCTPLQYIVFIHCMPSVMFALFHHEAFD
ncbi:hypothetical protein K435DRAFT_485729 [Dendrothele bispora CBS 962.96]|uniref:GATA-type domain-containing protein n=1 Tax=Dendrothele bispora (strain CBS 962.96) TaxID=1314807 RepID=A0A4V6T502_DENBC|nr:hypothetical protein K435DRAFT_485729 [Dendrothele bispora CBS 962.96]